MATRPVRLTVLGLCTLTSALISGFFYAYRSVMPSPVATDAQSAIKAVQGINAVVRNATSRWQGGRLCSRLLGTAIYGLGAFMVTLLYSVPLNEGLATVTPTPENAVRTGRRTWSRGRSGTGCARSCPSSRSARSRRASSLSPFSLTASRAAARMKPLSA